ncbi:MAG TPA: hypothetical protein VFQ22_13625, partial [Longimicrobiales bacterium]|nr:hypothetical protein [Longimicrobiales bacterium]
AGLACVRRPTGGRAVLHAAELTYCLVAPLGAWAGVRAAYARINAALAAAMRALGAEAELAGAGGRALPPGAGPCFAAPAAGEVVARGRKLIGSAQARVGRALLQHGSILLEGGPAVLAGVGVAGAAVPEAPARAAAPIGLRDLVGHVSIDAVARAVAMSLAEALGGTWAPGSYAPAEEEAARRLEERRYGRNEWTWRL